MVGGEGYECLVFGLLRRNTDRREASLGGVGCWFIRIVVDDLAEQVVCVASQMGAGGDHADRGLRKFRVKSRERITEVYGVVLVPEGPKDPFEFD